MDVPGPSGTSNGGAPVTPPRAQSAGDNCKPFGAPADPSSFTPVRIKYSDFRKKNLAFSLRMRMEMEREREMDMGMVIVIFGALKECSEVKIYRACQCLEASQGATAPTIRLRRDFGGPNR